MKKQNIIDRKNNTNMYFQNGHATQCACFDRSATGQKVDGKQHNWKGDRNHENLLPDDEFDEHIRQEPRHNVSEGSMNQVDNISRLNGQKEQSFCLKDSHKDDSRLTHILKQNALFPQTDTSSTSLHNH